MRNLNFRKYRFLSVVTVLTVMAASLFSESPLAYASSAVFILLLLILVVDFCGKGVSGHPASTIFIYCTFLIYVAVFSFILMVLYGELLPRGYLTSLYFPSLLLVSLFIFSRDPGAISIFILGFFVLMFFASCKVLYEYYSFLSQYGWSTQTNWGNFVGSSLIFVFLLKRIALVKTILFVGTIVVIFGLKRSGMLVLLFYWLIFIFVYCQGHVRLISSKFLIIGSLVLVGVFVSLYGFLIDTFSPVLDRAWSRVESVSEDGGSGRDRILMSGWSSWKDADIFSQTFGHGHGAFQRISGQASSLHNDFFEMIFSYGFFGFVFLFTIFFRFAFLAVKMYLNRSENLSFCLATAFAFLVYSNVSGIYYYPVFFCSLVVGYGYLEGSRAYFKSSPT